MKNEIKRKGFPFRPGAHEFDLHVRLRARNSLSLVSIYFQFAQPCFDIRLLNTHNYAAHKISNRPNRSLIQTNPTYD